MICRIWHGWTTTQNAPCYEEIVREEVIPTIEARRIPGFLSIDLVRRQVRDGFEFATIAWFADVDSVKTFVGEDYEVAHMPERARKVLSHFDARSAHFAARQPRLLLRADREADAEVPSGPRRRHSSERA